MNPGGEDSGAFCGWGFNDWGFNDWKGKRKGKGKEKGKDAREKGLGFSLGKDLLLLPWKMAEEQFEVAGGMAVDTRIQH